MNAFCLSLFLSSTVASLISSLQGWEDGASLSHSLAFENWILDPLPVGLVPEGLDSSSPLLSWEGICGPSKAHTSVTWAGCTPWKHAFSADFIDFFLCVLRLCQSLREPFSVSAISYKWQRHWYVTLEQGTGTKSAFTLLQLTIPTLPLHITPSLGFISARCSAVLWISSRHFLFHSSCKPLAF